MDRREMITILKDGYKCYEGSSVKYVYPSFGQLHPEVQGVAKEIGRTNFELVLGDKLFGQCTVEDFCGGEVLRLRSDYEDKPQEPEYDERPVTLASEFYLCVGVDLACVLGRKNFAGYKYADGTIGMYPIRMRVPVELNKPLEIEHPVSVVFRKDKA
jgi:hypothetical protein